MAGLKKIVFTEEFCQPENLFPFTLTRQMQDIRVGILTIREKWEKWLALPSFDKQEDDYKDLDRAVTIPSIIGKDEILLLHGNLLPTPELVRKIQKLKPGEFISTSDNAEPLAFVISSKEVESEAKIRAKKAVLFKEEINCIKYPWDIIRFNGAEIRNDFELLTKKRRSAKISETNRVSGKQLFLEDRVYLEHCIINANEGPVYIGKGANVMEGTIIRGPVSIGEGAVIKMGTKLYGGTTVGPYCIAGGEIKNSVMFSYSNKAHDGYLGDAVIGEWCNLGAGTSNSNLKNNASGVIVHTLQGPKLAGQKAGVFMGDHSRTAINTSINTGTVIGVGANVFGNGLTPKFIPSFSWGSEGVKRYEWEKAIRDINTWQRLKGRELTSSEQRILKHIFDHY